MLSIETCKKLKLCGFPQHSHIKATNPQEEEFACPSFDEIWALLPNEIYYDNVNYLLTLNRLREKSHTVISYRHQISQLASSQLLQLVAHNPTEAAAAMWLLIKKTDFTIIKP